MLLFNTKENGKYAEETHMTNEELINACRKAFTGFEINDRRDLAAALSEDVVFEFSDSLPYGGSYKGKAQFLQFWANVYSKYEYFHYDAHAVLIAQDYIIVPVEARAKTKTGFSMTNEHCFLFRFKDGQIVYGRIYADTARGRDVLEDREPRRYPPMNLS